MRLFTIFIFSYKCRASTRMNYFCSNVNIYHSLLWFTNVNGSWINFGPKEFAKKTSRSCVSYNKWFIMHRSYNRHAWSTGTLWNGYKFHVVYKYNSLWLLTRALRLLVVLYWTKAGLHTSQYDHFKIGNRSISRKGDKTCKTGPVTYLPSLSRTRNDSGEIWRNIKDNNRCYDEKKTPIIMITDGRKRMHDF